MNAIEPDVIEDLVAEVEATVGPIGTALYNLGAQIGDRALGATDYKSFEMGWRLGTFGLFRLASLNNPNVPNRQPISNDL